MTSHWLKNRTRPGWLAGAVAGAALSFAIVAINFAPSAQSAPTPPTITSGSFADVFAAVSPAVVNIIVTQTEERPTGGVQRFNMPQGQGRRGERPDSQDELEQ